MRVKLSVGMLLMGFIIAFVSTCKPIDYFPEEGVWYCSEHEMQLDFSRNDDSYIMLDSKKIHCDYLANIGSYVLTVCCQENDCGFFSLGEEILSMRFVSLDENTLIMKDLYGDKKYLFTRID